MGNGSKPWWSEPGVPWYAGLMSEAEAEEREQRSRTNMAVAEFLARPKPRRYNILDHGPWDNRTVTCLGCNRTQKELYSTPVMPPCEQ